MNSTWEVVTDYDGENTSRMKVPGGWIVKAFHRSRNNNKGDAMGMTFVPDPKHEWVLK